MRRSSINERTQFLLVRPDRYVIVTRLELDAFSPVRKERKNDFWGSALNFEDVISQFTLQTLPLTMKAHKY